MMALSDGPRDDARLVYHPAGHDSALRAALEDLRAGRWMAMRDLLAATGADWGLRTARSQVLATAAARSDVLRVWHAEEPDSADVVVMLARVAVERALQAHRQGRREVYALVRGAREACWLAGERTPADPVPWVCLLALAQADELQDLPEHRLAAPEQMLPPGPWGLLEEAQRRDPFNREAFHRMLKFWMTRTAGSIGDAIDFVQAAVAWAPKGSALMVLPLYAHVELYRQQRDREQLGPLLRRQWTRDHIAVDVDRALRTWFDGPAVAARAPLDLNHLAHGLWAGGSLEDAGRVFDAIGPYATTAPWAHVADEPAAGEREFLWARGQCRNPATRSAPTHPPG
jgi:hypothetical protein